MLNAKVDDLNLISRTHMVGERRKPTPVGYYLNFNIMGSCICISTYIHRKMCRSWRGDSVVKSMCCPCRRLKFSSQHPHKPAHPSISATGNPVPFSDFQGHLHSHAHNPMYMNTHTHKQIFKKYLKN